MLKLRESTKAIFFIALIAPLVATPNSYVPKLGKFKVVYENTNLIDTRGDFQRQPPDYHQKNHLAFKKEKNFNAELGLGYGFSIGYESIYRKVDSLFAIIYKNERYGHKWKPSKYKYDADGRIQLNDDDIYCNSEYCVRPIHITYSWYDNQVFVKKKFYDENHTVMTYQLGYIYQEPGSYWEKGAQQNSSSISFNNITYGDKAIGGHQINHELFIRKYFKLSQKRSSEYVDMDFKFMTDPDHQLLQAHFDIGVGFNLSKKNLLELKIGFETKGYNINRNLIVLKAQLYNKVSKYLWIKTAFTRKYAKGSGECDDIKITAITTGVEFKL